MAASGVVQRPTSEPPVCRLRPCAGSRSSSPVSRCSRAGCGKGSSSDATGQLVIAVDVPVTGSPYVAQTIRQGVELATSNLNGGGGIRVGSTELPARGQALRQRPLRPHRVENVRRAIDAGAVAIVNDGTGVDASWQLAKQAGVPIAITHDGGTGLVDAETRPNVFRIAPTNHGIAFRFAEYLIPKKLKLALLHDDSAYGREGAADIGARSRSNPEAVALKLTAARGPDRPVAADPARAPRRRDRAARLGAAADDRRRALGRAAASAGTCPSSRRRPAPTRSSASSSPTTRSGSTG